tara:strand:- start:10442 stop:10666 length:225 start_codon:yes stop_codon:yes gene_type:complete
MTNFHREEEIKHLSKLISDERKGISELMERILDITDKNLNKADAEYLDFLHKTRNTMIANVRLYREELQKLMVI